MFNKIIKKIRKFKNLSRVQYEDALDYVKMLMNNGDSEEEILKKVRDFIRS